ncbi:hypothetical protein HPB51_007321 [Rhipicephalus microplus]|uniref:CCHC-type domain-containing protein n=1 Tax=Rhipicephalus microplus TaxID=6941 RepID=A0A9J6EYH0_RHIMP|nr:hypothetical protein HPB51_007321 [Rhipicephalus microplus]
MSSARLNVCIIAADTTKRNSITKERNMQRKERSFQECLEFLMPVYLLPFVLGDRAGTSVYCVLLTMAGLMGRLLPTAIAAMLPIVILPLGGISSVDKLAAEYLGPHVLTAFLLFAIVIVGDETTIFFRLCLYALERYALRLQPLFLCMQFLVFALSLLLPSNLIVVFSTVFVDRFFSTVHNEIVGNADQRSSVRIQTSSMLNYFDEGRRPRWGRHSSITAFGRRARSVSMVSDTTVASEASAGSLIRQYRIHPASPELEVPDTSPSDWKMRKGVRKTSFSGFDQYERDQPYHLPVRRIRSFSVEPSQPSSILKRSLACGSGDGSTTSTFVASADTRQGTLGCRHCHWNGRAKEHLSHGTILDAGSGSCWRLRQAPVTGLMRRRCHAVSQRPSLCLHPRLRSPRYCPAGGFIFGRRVPAADFFDLGHDVLAFSGFSQGRGERCEPPAVSQVVPKERQASSTGRYFGVFEGANQSADATSRRNQAVLRSKLPLTTPESKPELKAVEAAVSTKCVVIPEAKAAAALGVQQLAHQDREPKQEVRGVLKKRSASLQPSLVNRRDSVLATKEDTSKSPLPHASLDNLAALQTPLSDTKVPGDKVSSLYYTGVEQQTSSLKVRALTTSARSAFIAGAAYTAIFGNLVNFNTQKTRKTLLTILDCEDDDCPVNFWSWLAVSLPVALICCVTSWMAIYCASLVSCMWEALAFYWIVGIPVLSCAYGVRHPDEYVEGPLLGLTLLGLSVSPAYSLRSCWTHRMLCWRQLCSRMPWNVILVLGSVAALTRTIEDFQLVEMGLSKLDDHFWSQRSTKSCQFILVSVAAIMSEIVLGDSLARSMATTVLRVHVHGVNDDEWGEASVRLAGLEASCDQVALLADLKSFIREEIARQFSLLPFAHPPAAQQSATTILPPIRRAIEQEIAEVMPAYQPQQLPAPAPPSYAQVVARPPPVVQPPAPLTYAEAAARPPPFTAAMPATYVDVTSQTQLQHPLQPFQPQLRPSAFTSWTRPTPANRWRTPDNRPICFACGYAGHVARYCHRVQPALSSPIAGHLSRPYHDEPPSMPPPSRPGPSPRRSPSPRRRSLSPMRPSSANHEREN